VAEDVGTTIAGIQGAITLFTLVMATLMITGGKIGNIIGRRRAFSIGLVIYACGSLTTALAPNLTVLLIGWSLLEGIGAALIMPAIVALVAGNVTMEDRPKAYGQIAARGIAIAVGPLIGGFATFFSWLGLCGRVLVPSLGHGPALPTPVEGAPRPGTLPKLLTRVVCLWRAPPGEWG
jgi:MFS family permease